MATTIGEVRVSDALSDASSLASRLDPRSPTRGSPDSSTPGNAISRYPFRKSGSACTMGRVPSFPGEGELLNIDHPNEGSLIASPRWSGGVRHRRQDESGQAIVEFAFVLFPLLTLVAVVLRHRPQLLARHEPDREPGCSLGGRQRLAARVPAPGHHLHANCRPPPATGVTRTRVKLQDTLKCMAMAEKGLQDRA